ncbi:FMN-dependent NADH-azoreductase [Alteromonadaceae bacterium 2753L.S.0a.02]|nr:FMN-dependent NADH-azoreductase [Alteromonadaceae bacterium 2753L.S.0a.02]
MSTKILHIDSSIFGEGGVSSKLGAELLKRLESQLGELAVSYRDLSADPIPHFDANTIAAISSGEAQLSDQLIAELQAADILVLGVPMYNFGVPSQLKAWFDHVARAGVTFKYTESGPVGLVQGKQAYVLASRGGKYQGTPADSQTPFVKTFLGFLGITDVRFIYAEGLNMGEDSRAEGIASAETAIANWVAKGRVSQEVA